MEGRLQRLLHGSGASRTAAFARRLPGWQRSWRPRGGQGRPQGAAVLRRARRRFLPGPAPRPPPFGRAPGDHPLLEDPDHGPSGIPVEQRAIQPGLRGDVLARYAKEWLLGVEDISDFVAEQRENAMAPYERLVTPREEVNSVPDPEVASRLGSSET
ncbi:DUF4291 family protein [Paludisphaera soli]|uniref:DUF4291 family protein n=1 Tax=Paludisphaera soli TaxID=2712865 RepID=UPI0013EB9BA7|nr:DUF4291 family protein [Paludisphaera soli]